MIQLSLLGSVAGQIANVASWSVPTPITLDTLLRGSMPHLDGVTGLLGFAVLAMAAIAWLTAAPTPRRPADRRHDRPSGRATRGAVATV